MNRKFLSHFLTWGTITGFAIIIFSLLTYFLNLLFNQAISFIIFIILLIFLIISLKNYRETILNGVMSYTQGLAYGLFFGIIASIWHNLFSFLLFTVIDSSLVEKMLAVTEENLMRQGLKQEQIDMMIKNFPSIQKSSILGVVGMTILNFFFTMIVAIFLKKKNTDLDLTE